MATTRTPRSSWVSEGLRALAIGGPDAVRVESIARALGVTKGGFYWHFDDRVALVDEMLDAWERVGVDDVIARIEEDGGEPRAKLRRLFGMRRISAGDAVQVDLAFREWARRDKKVARRLRRVDNRRMDYLRSLYAQFCTNDDDVESRAMLTYSLWIGSRFIAAEHGSRTRGDVMELIYKDLLR
jgi:AcrR family transcriptional regulator